MSELYESLNDFSPHARELTPALAHEALTNPKSEHTRLVLIRPLFQFLGARLAALRYLLQVQRAA